MKIAFIINHFESGGTEQVFLHLIRHFTFKGISCDLILFQKKGKLLNKLPKEINVYDLQTNINKLLDFPKIFKLAKKISKILDYSKPTIVYSGLWINNIVNVLSCHYSNFKPISIISDHISTFAAINYEISWKVLKPLKILLTKKYYRMADLIVSVSYDGAQEFIDLIGEKEKGKVNVIYNGIDIDNIIHMSNEKINIDFKYILAVGRIVKQKNYKLLIKAFSKIKKFYGDLKLVIICDDVSKHQKRTLCLKKFAAQMKVDNDVIFLHYQHNPYKYMKNALCLVVSSLYEGFGLVIVEALALGLPVISTRCRTGPSEILDGKGKEDIVEITEYGLLVPVNDDEKLAEALNIVLSNRDLARKFSHNGPKRVKENFSLEKMMTNYEDLFSIAYYMSKTTDKNISTKSLF